MKHSIKMTRILYLPSTAADLRVKEDTLAKVRVWFGWLGFFNKNQNIFLALPDDF